MKRSAILLAATTFVIATSASGAPACTQRTTVGAWAFKCEGEVPVGVPTRSLGTCVTTADAYWRCSGQINAGSVILQQRVEGQAHNNADCTGSIVYTQEINGQPAGLLDIDYVILDNGDTIWGLPLNSGGVLACTLQRLGKEPPRVK